MTLVIEYIQAKCSCRAKDVRLSQCGFNMKYKDIEEVESTILQSEEHEHLTGRNDWSSSLPISTTTLKIMVILSNRRFVVSTTQ
jgi:hypothetical protein